jgi:hypothetical protein
LLATLHLARAIGTIHGQYAKWMLVGGEGASSRRRPISAPAAFGRFAVFGLAAVVVGGTAFGIGAGLSRSQTVTIEKTLRAEDVTGLQLAVDVGDVSIVESDSLDEGELRVAVKLRTAKLDEDEREDELANVRLEPTGADGRTLVVECVDQPISLFEWKCDSDVRVEVGPGSDLQLTGGVDVGELFLDATFDEIDSHIDVGELTGTLDARDVEIAIDTGKVDADLAPSVRRFDATTDVGEVNVTAEGEWFVDADTNVGETQVDVPIDPGAERRMRIRTDVGAIRVLER